jgi:hypothetical protein
LTEAPSPRASYRFRTFSLEPRPPADRVGELRQGGISKISFPPIAELQIPVGGVDCVASLRRWTIRDAFGQALAATLNEMTGANDNALTVRLKEPFPLLRDGLAKRCSLVAVHHARADRESRSVSPDHQHRRLLPLQVRA